MPMKKLSIVLLSVLIPGTGLDHAVIGELFQNHAGEAWAVVGRPLTPMSYAGVARRTSRRTARRTAARVSGGYITALPAGCVGTVFWGLTYQHCGSVYYQPVYDGPEVVYIEVEDPKSNPPTEGASGGNPTG